MLYVTTRNKNDAHTAHKTLTADRGACGGYFVPFQMPSFSKEDVEALKSKNFGQCVADILNIFFNARLDGWDVDFSIGRYPVRLVSMSRRVMVAETWHNPDWDFARMVRNLAGRIRGNDDTAGIPSDWAWMSIRIATLFGLFGEMQRQGFVDYDHPIDIAVPTGDFSTPMAAWYAREMGLPIGNIVCSCNENCAVWDLLHHGQMRTDLIATPTNTPECDVGLPVALERLIFARLGAEEVRRFLDACANGHEYLLNEEQLMQLRKGFFSAVISQKRMESVIHNVFRSRTYLLDPCSSLAYGGLQDYRSGLVDGRNALLITERSPVCSAATVAKAMGVTVQELKERMRMN